MSRSFLPARILAIAAALLFPAAAAAQTLYVASMRNPASLGAGAAGLISGLYSVNLGTNAATFVAPLRVNRVKPVGVTGLGVHPTTGALYGVTSPLSPNNPRALVTIEPASGDVAVVADLTIPGSDIVFDPSGTLYMWLPATRQLATVNTANGTVVPMGSPGAPDATGGLAMDSKGVVYVTATGAGGTLDTVDLKTGAIIPGPRLSGAPFPNVITAMTFTPSGLLMAVNSNSASPASTRLVTINVATGVITSIGQLPDDSDGLTFVPVSSDMRGVLATMSGRTMALLALIIGVVLAVLAMGLWRLFKR